MQTRTQQANTGEQSVTNRDECESCGSEETERMATRYVTQGVLEIRMCYSCGSGYTIGYSRDTPE